MDNQLIAALRLKDKKLAIEGDDVEMQLKTLNERLGKIRGARFGIQAILTEEGALPEDGAALTNITATPKTAEIRAGTLATPVDPLPPQEAGKPLLAVLNDELAGGPRSTAELGERLTARGYPFGAKSPLRVIHATLTGASQTGAFVKSGDKWRIGHSPR